MPNPTQPAATGNQNDVNTLALIELASVKGQLGTVIQMLQHNHLDTHRRIDDLSKAVDRRFDDMSRNVNSRFNHLDERVEVVETRERSTAIRTAVYGGSAAALVTAVLETLKHYRP